MVADRDAVHTEPASHRRACTAKLPGNVSQAPPTFMMLPPQPGGIAEPGRIRWPAWVLSEREAGAAHPHAHDLDAAADLICAVDNPDAIIASSASRST